eukprot:m.243116 g.243116  ORF g.243116 m.243116 type:complete len:770 (+) comp26966_c0_seq1:53-2362(+)
MRLALVAGSASFFVAIFLHFFFISSEYSREPARATSGTSEKASGGLVVEVDSLLRELLALNQARLASVHYPTAPSLKCAPPRQYIDPELMLPIYLLVIGVEGTGHNAMETVWSILSQFYDTAILTFDAHFHGIHAAPNVSRGYHCTTISREYSRFLVKEYLRMPRIRGKQLVIDARNSFPEGFGASSLAHPDILHLASFDGELFDFRAIVLTREHTASVVSSVKRFFTPTTDTHTNTNTHADTNTNANKEEDQTKDDQAFKNHLFQARATERLLSLINNNVELLPCGKTLHIPYETLTGDNTTSLAEPLARLLSVSLDHINASLTLIHKNKGIAQTAKVASNEVQTLNRFFSLQRVLWPALTGPAPSITPSVVSHTLVPRNKRRPITAPPLNGREGAGATKYLMIDCQRHLGFNNMLFVMEMGLYLARMLGRRLAFNGFLRMRRCEDKVLCNKSSCQAYGGEYECPLGLFLDMKQMNEVGIDWYRDEKDLLDRYSAFHDLTAFDTMYAETSLVIDHVPTDPTTGSPRVSFPYYQIKFTCELVPTKIYRHTYNHTIARATNTTLIDFVAKYAHIQETILYLHGTPHRVGLTPVLWASERALHEARGLWHELHIYNTGVTALGRQLVGLILGRAKADSFTCVHLRRDDFTDLGWNKKALDLTKVIARINQHRRSGEGLYIATDEERLERLAPLRDLGAVFWADFASVMRADKNAAEVAMLGFKDYVGLVEQSACVKARSFLGSHCSSLTGTIVNMRRELKGEGVVIPVSDE